MLRISLLNKDLRTMPEKIMDKVNKLRNEKKENDLQNEPLKLNKSYDNILSKTGLGNTMRGSQEVINRQNNSLKESTMGQTIPIKQIILQEFDFVRNNPVASTLGAAALGGAIVHDYHKSGSTGIGNHIENKLSSAKSWVHDVTGKGKTPEPNHVDPSVQHDSIISQAASNPNII